MMSRMMQNLVVMKDSQMFDGALKGFTAVILGPLEIIP
jgi:hypothetical protein